MHFLLFHAVDSDGDESARFAADARIGAFVELLVDRRTRKR
jgi:hypothetical protein